MLKDNLNWNKKSLLYKIKLIIMISFVLLFTACGGGDGDGGEDPNVLSTSINIKGSVNDKPVPFAKVSLVLSPQDKLLKSFTADKDGKWSCMLEKSQIPSNSFIFIKAQNENNLTIRSLVDTNDILESVGDFESTETVVSHYTEAIITLAEADEKQEAVISKEIKKYVSVINDKPVKTGIAEIDEVAKEIQANFDDNTSSQDKFKLSIYKKLLEREISTLLPDENGVVTINLPVAYDKNIKVTVELSVKTSVTYYSDRFTFTLTPKQAQENIDITITATLNETSITKTLTMYALGNSKTHYKYIAVAPLSDTEASTTTIMINGRYYTVVPYSFAFVDPSNAEINGIEINGSINNRQFNTLKVANNYAETKLVFRVYQGKSINDLQAYIGESEIISVTSDKIDIKNIFLSQADDFRPPQPSTTDIELPPMAPEF